MKEIMHYLLFGLVTLGLTGGFFVFVYESFKVIKTMWKWGWWGKVVFITLGLMIVMLTYAFVQFAIIGFHAFFN